MRYLARAILRRLYARRASLLAEVAELRRKRHRASHRAQELSRLNCRCLFWERWA